MKILIKSHLLLIKDIVAVNLDKINFDNNTKCDEVDPDTTIHVKILCWHSKFEKRKALKKHK